MMELLHDNEMADLVSANHILYKHGVVDGFGHVSIRDPREAGRFWMSRSMAPGLVQETDILPFDLDCVPLIEDAPPVYAERFIHGEIYRSDPNIMSVVHSHAAPLIPFGTVAEQPLRPICHMSGFLGKGAPIFEIRDHAGTESDLLIRDPQLGAALASTLGSAPVILMRGHGATIVGHSLRQAVFRAVYAAENAALQQHAMQLGSVNFLTPGEADVTAACIDTFIDRAWDLWASEARKA